jgi:PAS domain S-box-containing protein
MPHVIEGVHDPRLVALSVLVSILGAYAARGLSERINATRGGVWLAWLVGGAMADGTGTWSMHYTAMLGFWLPVPVEYHWPTVLLSWVVGILGSAAALSVARSRHVARALASSVFLGVIGISGLHYTAMGAMRLEATQHHPAALVILSVVVAIAVAFMAVAVGSPGRGLRNHAGTVLRGTANPAMHYTAMAAVSFVRIPDVPDLSHAVSMPAVGLAGITIVPVTVLVVALVTSVADRFRAQRTLLDELFEQAPQAVALLDSDGRVMRVNSEFTRLFGWAPHEARGRRLGELIVPEEAREDEQRYDDLVAQGRRVDGEGIRQRQDGSRLHVSMVRVPVSVPRGQVVVYAIYRDVTERHRAQEMLQTFSQRLIEAQEAERCRIAQELHDEIGQLLTGLRLLLETRVRAATEVSAIALREADELITSLMGRLREMVLDLRPPDLDALGLLPALFTHVERFTRQTGVQVRFQHSGLDRRFSPDVETAVYRIVQEALTNVARHAAVREATVRVWADQAAVHVQVEDRGRGFDVSAAEHSVGITGMRERALLIGGSLDVESAPGRGTVVTADIPLRDERAARPRQSA